MNKKDLVNEISKRVDLDKKDISKVISILQDVVTEALVEDKRVKLVGFGTFGVTHRAEREGRNPRKPGEVITIPAVKSPNFKAGKTLKDKVNDRI